MNRSVLLAVVLVVLGVMGVIGVLGCGEGTSGPAVFSAGDRYKYFILEVEGHRYLVLTNGGRVGGGVGVTHLESCPCKGGVSR